MSLPHTLLCWQPRMLLKDAKFLESQLYTSSSELLVETELRLQDLVHSLLYVLLLDLA